MRRHQRNKFSRAHRASPAARRPLPAARCCCTARRLLPAARCRRSRHGVILLVVLGMLALFTVVVLTFVIVARQHQQAAISANRGKVYDESYEDHLNQAALQVIRGTSNLQSAG